MSAFATIPKTAPFSAEDVEMLNRVVGPASPIQRAWLAGFLAGDAVLLVHDRVLLELVDGWIAGLDETTFEDLLPLVRRTFSGFSRAERRTIGERVSRLDGVDPRLGGADPRLDLEQATPALHAVARLLGWEVVTRDGAA